MKIVKKIILAVVVLAVVIGVVWVGIHWEELVNFRKMPSGAYAKFMCSALFVDEVSEEQARVIARVSVPVKEINIDYENKAVTARALFYTSTAQYVNDKYGCTLK